MPNEPTAFSNPYADIAPALGDYTDKVHFGDLWKRPGLSPRDRSLITVTSLVALYRTNELPFHLKKAIENGVTKEELMELITHLAFYSGWPTANTAVAVARKVFGENAQWVKGILSGAGYEIADSEDHGRLRCRREPISWSVTESALKLPDYLAYLLVGR